MMTFLIRFIALQMLIFSSGVFAGTLVGETSRWGDVLAATIAVLCLAASTLYYLMGRRI
jgi:hypothetical protein